MVKRIDNNLGSTIDYNSQIQYAPDVKRSGEFWATGGTAPATGHWQNFMATIAVGTGAFSNVSIDSTGTRGNWLTNATINSICGTRVISLLTERDLNPYTKWKIAFPTAVTTLRFFIGYMSTVTAPVSAADYLANLSGVGFWYDSSVDAHLHIMQNDGSASSDTTTIGNIADPTTAARTYELRADNTNSRFQYSYDGGTFTNISTKIPAATTDLTWQWFCECLTGSASRTMSVWYVFSRWDSP